MRMEEFLEKIGVGLRPIDDAFFEDSYNICKIFQRKGITDEDDEHLFHEAIKEFPCYATGCKATFHTLLDFEMHYNTSHRYVCAECKKSLPNPRLLDIHIQETHDSFFQVLSMRQPMYQCYVSECDLKFNNAMERRDHCTSVHKFPKNFRFDNAPHRIKDAPKEKMDIDESHFKKKETKIKNVLLDKNQRSRMFMGGRKSTISVSTNIQGSESKPMDAPSGASPLVFIPRQVKKSYTNALTNNQSSEKNVLETGCMMELVDSLPD